jgi:hypothetical protein
LGADRFRLCFKLIPPRDPVFRYTGVYQFRHSRFVVRETGFEPARSRSTGHSDSGLLRTCMKGEKTADDGGDITP